MSVPSGQPERNLKDIQAIWPVRFSFLHKEEERPLFSGISVPARTAVRF
jgi:hypothetical protein